jgi:hypothetical protein
MHLGAEWTSPSDRTFASRLIVALIAIVLAAAGAALSPLVLVSALAATVLAQLAFEAITPMAGEATAIEPTMLTMPTEGE